MAFSKPKGRTHAPLWMALFSAGAALSRVVGERYLLKREWTLRWKDVLTAIGGALVGYLIFRKRRGNERAGFFTR